MSSKAFDKMLEWLDENMTEGQSLPDISAYVAYSEYSCSAKRRKFGGITFQEYMEAQRLAAASKALGTADSRIIGIALDCGFSSGEAFSRAFGREYGRSPAVCLLHKDTDEG